MSLVNTMLVNYSISNSSDLNKSLLIGRKPKKRKLENLNQDFLISTSNSLLSKLEIEKCKNILLQNQSLLSSNVQLLHLEPEKKKTLTKHPKLGEKNLQNNLLLNNEKLSKTLLQNKIISTMSMNLQLQNLNLTSNNLNTLLTNSSLMVAKTTTSMQPKSHKHKEIKLTKDQEFTLPNVDKMYLDNEVNLHIKAFHDADIKFPSSLNIQQSKVHDKFDPIKVEFIDAVCSSLLNQPRYMDKSDKTRIKLMKLASKLSEVDPEFILKLALYCRQDLNVRSTSNFLICVAATFQESRPFLKKYYSASVQLPTDWMIIAEYYQKINYDRSITASLRKVMVEKFLDFDQYQLAKYNKDKSKSAKKKQKKEESKKAKAGTEPAENDNNINENMETETDQKSFQLNAPTLKSLIRQLHITRPAFHVMSILGKKYPSSMDEFYACGLEGSWDCKLSGTRMKLPVPTTWETQLSAKGNNAKTWQDLLDKKAIPYMAMLRNIRNMIKVGISEKHHNSVLKLICNERSVERGRQFPFCYFSAYQVLDEMEQELDKQEKYKTGGIKEFLNRDLAKVFSAKRKFGEEKSDDGKKIDGIRRQLFKKYNESFKYDKIILERYRKSLNSAIEVATRCNVNPIKGKSLIICNVSNSMNLVCDLAKGLGNNRSLSEIGILLGLMCSYSCESSTFVIYTSSKTFQIVEVEKGGILTNLKSVLELSELLNHDPNETQALPTNFLNQYLFDSKKIDNIVLLSRGLQSDDEEYMDNFLNRYRDQVYESLMFYEVNLSGKKCSLSSSSPLNIRVSGYSDQILRYIAEGGGAAQLSYVNNIDKIKGLKMTNTRVELPPILPLPQKPQPPKILRVFISSTVIDMHAERDALVQYVFPEVRRRAKKLNMEVYECDLRWGVYGENSQQNVKICLDQVKRCNIFIGIIGERYGWVPTRTQLPHDKCYDWLKGNFKNHSITEMEIIQGAFLSGNSTKSLFYFRDSSDLQKIVPKEHYKNFFEFNEKKQRNLKKLKKRLLQSDLNIRTYSATYCGIGNEKPVITGLEQFCDYVIEDLMESINCIVDGEKDDEMAPVTYLQESVSQQWQSLVLNASKLVGKQSFLSKIEKNIVEEQEKRLIILHGIQGCGKTTVMSYLAHKIYSAQKRGDFVLSYSVGSSLCNTSSVKLMLLAFIQTFNLDEYRNKDFSLNHDLTFLSNEFWSQVEEMKSSEHRTKKLFIFIDGIDLLSNDDYAQNMQWILAELPGHVTMILSCKSDCNTLKILQQRSQCNLQPIPLLNPRDRPMVIKRMLSDHSKLLNESHFNNQLQKLLMKKSANIPIYLDIACHYIRLFCDYESLDQDINKMSPDLIGLIEQWLEKVEQVMSSKVGKKPVAVMLGVIHCSSYGINEQDLHEILTLCFGKCSDKDFYQLFHLLNLFLTENKTEDGIKLNFSNSIYSQAVQKRYLTKENGSFKKYCHKLLSCYYIILLNGSDQFQYYNAINHLPYHLTQSGDYESLMKILSNFSFIGSKCQSGNAVKLLDDFLNLSTVMSSNPKLSKNGTALLKICDDFKDLITCNISLLATHPHMLYQLCINRDQNSFPYKAISEQINDQENKDFYLVECVSRDNTKQLFTSLDITATTVSISPNGKLVACGVDNGSVVIFSTITCKKIQEIIVGTPTSVIKFVSKKYLICGHKDGSLNLVNSLDGTIICKLSGHRRFVSDILIRDKLVVTCSHDRTIKTWNFTLKPPRISDGSLIPTDKLIPNCVDIHPTQHKVVGGMWDGTMRIWEISSKKRVAIIRGGNSSVTSVRFSKCERYIFSCALYGVGVRVNSAENGFLVGVYGAGSTNMTNIDTMGQCIVAGGGAGLKSGVLSVWGGKMGKLEAEIEMTDKEAGQVRCCAFNKNQKTLAVGCHGNTLALISTDTQKIFYQNKIYNSSIRCLCWFYSLDLENSQEYIICGYEDSTLNIFSVLNKSIVATCKGHSGAIVSLSSSSMNIIASASEDFTIRIWSLKNLPEDPKLLHVLHGHQDVALCLSFNESLELASGGKDMRLIFHKKLNLDKRSSEDTAIIHNAHEDWITCCSWHTQSKHLVTGSNDGQFKIWLNGVLTKTMSSNTGAITGISYKGGCILVSGSSGLFEMWSHHGVQITTLDTKSRVNSCDLAVTMVTKEQEKNEIQDLNWAAQVYLNEWLTSHQKNLPGSNRPLKSLMNQFKMVNVATTHDNGVIKLWRPLVGDEQAVLPCNSSLIKQVGYGSSCVVSNSITGNIFLWNLKNLPKKCNRKIGHDSEITCLEILKNCIITADIEGYVKIWTKNVLNMELLASAKAHLKKVSYILVLNESNFKASFLTSGFDQIINLWELNYIDFSYNLRKYTDMSSPPTIMVKISETLLCIANTVGEIIKATLDNEKIDSIEQKCGLKKGHFNFCWPHEAPKAIISDKGILENIGQTQHSEELCELTPDQFIWSIGDCTDDILLGDNNGYLHIPKQTIIEKIHDDRITAILSYNNLILTCSYDRSIKLWQLNPLKQVGQYFGVSAYTKANICQDYVLCCDVTGVIHVFKLHPFNCSAGL